MTLFCSRHLCLWAGRVCVCVIRSYESAWVDADGVVIFCVCHDREGGLDKAHIQDYKCMKFDEYIKNLEIIKIYNFFLVCKHPSSYSLGECIIRHTP